MTPEQVLLAWQIVAPAVAAFMAVKASLATTTEKADNAAKSAARAHVRLDDHLSAHK